MSTRAVVKWTASKASAAGDVITGVAAGGPPNFQAWNVVAGIFAIGAVGIAWLVHMLIQLLILVGILLAALVAGIRRINHNVAKESRDRQARAAAAAAARRTTPKPQPTPPPPARAVVVTATARDLPREITSTRSPEYVIDVEVVPEYAEDAA